MGVADSSAGVFVSAGVFGSEDVAGSDALSGAVLSAASFAAEAESEALGVGSAYATSGLPKPMIMIR